jgi:LPS sulfotransferase NodH
MVLADFPFGIGNDAKAGTATKRFVIIGLPRSGTTYLSTLLDAHPRVYCSGEEFNPYAVINAYGKDDRHETILARDRAPIAHLEKVFKKRRPKAISQVGLKFMLGHNLNVLRFLETQPDISILHVWRDNRLAQVASLKLALQTKEWARIHANRTEIHKIHATPRDISHKWHEFATLDHLFSDWLKRAPNPNFSLDYRSLFKPDFKRRISGFLGLDPGHRMRSPLKRQGPSNVLDRFHDPEPIKYYFTQIGRSDWLKPEL